MIQSRSRIDFGTLLLLALLLAMAAYTISSSDWAPGLDLLQPTSLAGLLMGTLLTRTRFQRLPAHLLALGYGAAWIGFVSIAHLPREPLAPGLTGQIAALAKHIGEWVWLLLNTGVGKDNFMFLLSLMAVFWLLGYLAAWYTFKLTRVLRVVLPPGLVILVNLYYYGGQRQLSVFLYLYFIFALLYVARVYFTTREREWQRARVGYDSDVRGSFVRGGSIVTLVAVLAAWFVPEVAPMPQFEDLWRQISKPIRSIEDSFNRIFSTLQGEGPALANPFGRTLGFAGPRDLGNTVMMDVYVRRSKDNASALARYWRAGTFDVYTSNGWINSDTEAYVYRPNTDPLPTSYLLRSNVEQTFTFYFPLTSQLLALSQPVYFNREAEADARLLTATDGLNGQLLLIDPSYVIARDPLRSGDSYDAVSAVSIADVETLRQAGANYPTWVRDSYLQLPDSFPQRVKDLARQIVTEANATNPFDQATALESWLRRNVTYNERIDGPRPGQDGVDYVLFESRAGYCDYYASAMATMARSLGIPARVAVGYARGTYESAGDVYRVRQREAHSWVEVFFPDYGWIEFEPTTAQPLINRPIEARGDGPEIEPPLAPTPVFREDDLLERLRAAEADTLFNQGNFATTLLTQVLPGGVIVLASTAAVLAVVATVTMYAVENYGLRRLRGTQWAYARLVRLARWLRVDLRAYQTPFEQATLLGHAAPATQTEIDAIAGDYVRETFGRDDSGADHARSIWQRVRLRLWWVGLKRRVRGSLARYQRPRLLRLRFPRRR
jgi:transglutaminase-like putative cysteine protease